MENMYNILRDLEEVFKTLDRRGLSFQVPRNMFIAEVKRATSVFNDKTIAKWLKNFIELGYIRTTSNFVIFERCVSFENPYVFEAEVDYNITKAANVDLKQNKKIVDIDQEIDNIKEAEVLKE